MKLKSLVLRLASVAALAAVVGCTSFRSMQTAIFVNDDGQFIDVEYGTGDEHVTTFISPGNGEEMEMRTKLRVIVTMPDGERLLGFQCMNFLPSGTMYETDNKEYMFHANGFTFRVFRMLPDKSGYARYYEGVLSQTIDNPKKNKKKK